VTVRTEGRCGPSAGLTPVGDLWSFKPASLPCAWSSRGEQSELGVILGLNLARGETVKGVSEVSDT
jgi:hypothetical protein